MQKSSEGKFLKIACPRCGNHQVVYGKSSTRTKCERCNKLLVKVTGGKVKVRAPVMEVL